MPEWFEALTAWWAVDGPPVCCAALLIAVVVPAALLTVMYGLSKVDRINAAFGPGIGPGRTRAGELAFRMERIGRYGEAEELLAAAAGPYGVSAEALDELEAEVDYQEGAIADLF